MNCDTKIIYKEFCASCLGAVDVIVWKFHLEAGAVYVCAGSDRLSGYIRGDSIDCHNPDHCSMGVFIIPAGIVFLCPVDSIVKYVVTLVSFCGMQIAISVFSIFAVSLIQQRTPDYLIGKVMAYTSTVTLCVQPIGQMVYGLLFDRFNNMIYLRLIPTGVIVWAVGMSAMGFFRKMEKDMWSIGKEPGGHEIK